MWIELEHLRQAEKRDGVRFQVPRVLGREDAIPEIGDAEALKLGRVAQPMRAALTGSNISPGIFDVLVVLGREESLARLKDQAASQ